MTRPVLGVIEGGGAPATAETAMAWRCPRCGELEQAAPDLAVWIRLLNTALERAGKGPAPPLPCEDCRPILEREEAERKHRQEAAERVAAAKRAREIADAQALGPTTRRGEEI